MFRASTGIFEFTDNITTAYADPGTGYIDCACAVAIDENNIGLLGGWQTGGTLHEVDSFFIYHFENGTWTQMPSKNDDTFGHNGPSCQY